MQVITFAPVPNQTEYTINGGVQVIRTVPVVTPEDVQPVFEPEAIREPRSEFKSVKRFNHTEVLDILSPYCDFNGVRIDIVSSRKIVIVSTEDSWSESLKSTKSLLTYCYNLTVSALDAWTGSQEDIKGLEIMIQEIDNLMTKKYGEDW